MKPGESLGHYRIEKRLGVGGMGEVYLAVDTKLNRPVALKALRREFLSDPERHRRFVQEARAASALDYPNIVTIHDIAEEGGVHFILT
jgi:serine/threonine-protein kinase